MKDKDLIIYRVVTVLFTLLMLGGVSQYIFAHEMVVGMFEQLKFPAYLIYPMATAKTLGVIAIWANKSKMLKEWAYAGFVFNLLLAISAHINMNDGQFMGATVGLILVIVSYIYNKKVYAER